MKTKKKKTPRASANPTMTAARNLPPKRVEKVCEHCGQEACGRGCSQYGVYRA